MVIEKVGICNKQHQYYFHYSSLFFVVEEIAFDFEDCELQYPKPLECFCYPTSNRLPPFCLPSIFYFCMGIKKKWRKKYKSKIIYSILVKILKKVNPF